MSGLNPNEITLLLQKVDDPEAFDRLVEAVYADLRRLANRLVTDEGPGGTIGATELVHEAYMRLDNSGPGEWESSRHFFNACAMVMRRALVDRARRRSRIKRGGDARRVDVELDVVDIPAAREFNDQQLADLDEHLGLLEQENRRWAEVLHMRLFLGMTVPEAARTLSVSEATVKNDYRFAIAWLRSRLVDPDAQSPASDSGSDG